MALCLQTVVIFGRTYNIIGIIFLTLKIVILNNDNKATNFSVYSHVKYDSMHKLNMPSTPLELANITYKTSPCQILYYNKRIKYIICAYIY